MKCSKKVVGLHLYFVEADANNFDPWNKNGGGFGLVYKRILALVSILVLVDDVGDQTILSHAIKVLIVTITIGVQRLHLAGKNRKGSFLVIIIVGILDANKKWDRGRKVTISKGSFSILFLC